MSGCPFHTFSSTTPLADTEKFLKLRVKVEGKKVKQTKKTDSVIISYSRPTTLLDILSCAMVFKMG